MSNYPPGVTGMEWEIAGPDYEKSITHWCPDCEAIQGGTLIGFGSERWWICDECGEQVDEP